MILHRCSDCPQNLRHSRSDVVEAETAVVVGVRYSLLFPDVRIDHTQPTRYECGHGERRSGATGSGYRNFRLTKAIGHFQLVFDVEIESLKVPVTDSWSQQLQDRVIYPKDLADLY
jgi:hypothetical protein